MHDSTNGVFAIRKLSALVRLAPRVNHFIRYNLTISGRIRLVPIIDPLCRTCSISCQTYPISYDGSQLSPILKPARVGEQGSKQ